MPVRSFASDKRLFMQQFLPACLLFLSLPLLTTARQGLSFSPEKELDRVAHRLAAFEPEGPADSVVYYYQKQADLLCQLDRLDDWLYSYWDLQAYFYEDSERALGILEAALQAQWRPPASALEWEALLWVLTNQGYHAFQLGKVLASARAYEQAAAIYSEQGISDFDIVSYVYLPLGAHYTRLGDNERARAVYRRALGQDGLSPEVRGGLYNNLGLAYWDEGDFGNAERQFIAGLAVAGLPAIKKALLLINQGRNEYDLGKRGEAQLAAQQALRLLAPLSADETVLDYRSGAQALLGLLAAARGAYENSEGWFEQALENGIAAYGTTHHRVIGKIFLEIGRMRVQSRNGEGALQAANRALQSVLPSFEPRLPESLPPAELFYEENTIMEALELKGDALQQLARLHSDSALFKLALQSYEQAIEVEELLSGTFRYESARLLLQAKSRARTEKALALAYQLQEEPGVRERAFAIAEKSKAGVLLAAIRDNLARREIQQGDTLLAKEGALRRLRAYLQKELILGADEGSRIMLERRLAEATDRLAQLEADLGRKYPRLGTLDKQPVWTPGEVAEKLLSSPASILIEYFTGRSHLFAFQADASGGLVMACLDTAGRIQAPLYEFLHLLRSRNDLSSRRPTFLNLAHQLYGQLLQPLLENGGAPPSEVILIPDGQLAFLPFEALVTEKTEQESWAGTPFVLKKYLVRYAYSAATLWRQSQLKGAPERNLLEVAPGFPNGERGLAPLNDSGLDFDEIGISGVEVLKAKAATGQKLENCAGQFRVLHLSTHAQSDSTHTRPRIELFDAPLYLPELYALNLRAELVTISACETGLGNLAEGEGVMSLARGFAYAGAASLVSSLWAVNEQSTTHIFSRFYLHLAGGLPKGRALQRAKLDYLDSELASFQKSPYYWAGLVLIGDGAPVAFKTGWPLWMIGGGVLLLCGVLMVGYWLRR